MQLIKWLKSGALFEDQGQAVFYTSTSHQCVDLGGGNFAPYVIDSKNNSVKFANSELRLTPYGIELWRDGGELVRIVYDLEVKKSAKWEKESAQAVNLAYNAVKVSDIKECVDISYDLIGSDIEATITMRVGGSGIIHWGYAVLHKVAGEHRLNITQDIVEKGVLVQDKNGITIGYNFPDIDYKWRWKANEAQDRYAADDVNVDTEIFVKEGTYEAGQITTISPDETTLESGWSADVNTSHTCYASDGSDWAGISGTPLRVAQRWDISAIDGAWTISAVETRSYVESVVGSPGALYFNRYGTGDGGEDPSGDCGVDAYTKAQGTNYTSISEPSAAAWFAFTNLGAQAITDLESAADDNDTYWSIGLDCRDAGAGEYVTLSEYDEANDPELKVTYTTGGGGLSIPIAMHHYKQLMGAN